MLLVRLLDPMPRPEAAGIEFAADSEAATGSDPARASARPSYRKDALSPPGGVAASPFLVSGSTEAVEPLVEDSGAETPLTPVAVQGVVTAGARPVPGAELWAVHEDLEGGQKHVASADSSGRFSLEAAPDWELSARKPSLRPSPCVELASLEVDDAGFLPVELAMGNPGGRLEVGLRWPDGRAVVGARVELRNTRHGEAPSSLVRGRVSAPLGWYGEWTDELGVAVLAKVPDSRNVLRVLLPDGTGFQARVVLSASTDEYLPVVVPPRSPLVVSVVGADGKPARGAELVLERNQGLPALRGRTDRMGRFEAELFPGPLLVRACARGRGLAESAYVRTAAGPALDAPGEVQRLELELGRTTTIHGRVEGHGGPILVELEEAAAARQRVSELRARGRTHESLRLDPGPRGTLTFAFAADPSREYVLRFLDEAGRVIGQRDGVRSGGDAIVVPGNEAAAQIRGRIAGSEAQLAHARLALASCSLPREKPVELERGTGRFHCGGLAPGEYVLRAHLRGYGFWEVARLELESGELRSLGELTPPTAGTVVAELIFPAQKRVKSPRYRRLVLRSAGTSLPFGQAEWVKENELWVLRARFEAVPEGDYELCLRSAGVADLLHPIRVPGAGEVTERVALQRGRLTMLLLELDAESPTSTPITLVIDGPDGRERRSWESGRPVDLSVAYTMPIRLRPAAYTVTVETACGLSGTARFEVERRGGVHRVPLTR